MAKQMIDFQKTAFNNGFSTLTLIQDQTETMFTSFMAQFPWVTDDGKKQINDAFTLTKKATEEFKKAIDEGYNRFETVFDAK